MPGVRPSPPGRAREWSWHRLADDVASELVVASGVGLGDLVLDLGAGGGAITRRLAATGGRVIAFELHPGRADSLRRLPGNVKVVRADVRDLRLPTRPFSVVANPPFRGVSAVLVRLTHPKSRLQRADLVVPRSVANEWARRLQRRDAVPFVVASVRQLPRSAFTPRPRIDCSVIVITRRDR